MVIELPEMIFVEGGEYEKVEDFIKRKVIVSSYFIGKYTVTQKLWIEIMKDNPSEYVNTDLPVDSVSWYDCQKFIEKLNELTGRNFRLPTEEEWEFAAIGGNSSKGYDFSGSDELDKVGWYGERSGTHHVGKKKSNELGIYDMSGNVWEWCNDWFNNNEEDKVVRGGAWDESDYHCRTSYRTCNSPDNPCFNIGFRLAEDKLNF